MAKMYQKLSKITRIFSRSYHDSIVAGFTALMMLGSTSAVAQNSATIPVSAEGIDSGAEEIPEQAEVTPVSETSSETTNESNSASDLELSPENSRSAPESMEESPAFSPSSDPDYILPPQVAADEKLHPFTTTVLLNETPISHLTKWQFSAFETFADTTNSDIFVNGILKLDARVVESLTQTNIYTVDQKGTYLQLRTVPRERTVTTTTTEPQTMSGLEMQMSLTGNCVLPDTPSDRQCTYMPGLVTDRNSIDPELFVPTRTIQTSEVGEVVEPETLAAMEAPGFQGGTPEQPIGLDLYFPNSGSVPGNSQSQTSKIEREEENDYTFAATLSGVRQVVKANHREAAIGRTIRGFTVFGDDENRGLNLTLQTAAQFLPDVIPDLEGSENPVNININRNLFLSANNIRLPRSSFTIYSAGLGRAESLTADITSLNQVPRANYNSVWFGFSPVIDRSFRDGRIFYEATGPQLRRSDGGGEGGSDSNVELLSVINQDFFSTNTLESFYAQVYLSFLQQDVNRIRQDVYQEDSDYYPHISFTGNSTGSQDILRYYSGAIVSEELKVYLGTDYSKNTVNGWIFGGGAIGYINPDRDYYSQIWGNAAKRIRFSNNANLTLATGFNYALDRETNIGDVVSISPASEVVISAGLNWGIASLGLTNYFGDILPNSYEDRLLANLTLRPINNLTLSGYIAPIDETSSRSPYGASVVWQLENKPNSPTLSFNWQKQEYDYGEDVFGNDLLVNDDTFTVLFRVGHPGNPFSPVARE